MNSHHEPSLEEKRARLAELLRQRGHAAPSIYPLSEGQRALWFLHQVAPASGAFNIAFTARIVSAVDADAMHQAWDALVARHDALRSRVVSVEGVPSQEVQATMPAPFEMVEGGARSEEILEEIAAEIKRPFDLARGPLLRVRLYRSVEGEWFLAATFHHIVFDGWSLWVCLAELQELYAAAAGKRPDALQPPPARYAQYVRAESDMLAAPIGEQHRTFWQTRLGQNPPAVLNLPTDRPRPPAQRYQGAAYRFELDPMTTGRLRELAQHARCTLQMAALTVFTALLQRYTSQRDFVVGYLAAGRVRPEFEDVVGYLANALPLRCHVPADGTFRSLLAQTKTSLLEAFDHQDYPFPRVLDAIKIERDSSRSPLFQTLFVFEKPHLLAGQDLAPFIVGEPGARIELGELVLESLPFSAQQEGQFDLTFVAVEREQTLACAVDYRTDLFDTETVARFAGHFARLAGAAADAPDAPLATLPIVTRREEATLAQWNQTQAAIPDGCFHQVVERHAERQPDAAAVIGPEDALSYGELNARANRLARHLRRLGVGRDVIVGLCVERSTSLIAAALGILKAGGAFLPLDPAYPASRLAFMLEDAQVTVLVTQSSLAGTLPESRAQVVCVDRDESQWATEPADNLAIDATPDDLMYVIYTSGSTGRPKGVLLAHRGLMNVSAEQQRLFGAGPGSQVLQFAALSFDAAVFEIAMALGSGGTLHVARPEQLLPGLPLLDTLRTRGITIVTLPPSALMNVPVAHLPQLRTVTVAGEACPAELVTRWADGRDFFNLYGPTEATIWSTALRCTSGARPPTIGRPIANTQLVVLDDEAQRVPVGIPGELHLGGIGLARGYLGQPSLTATKFIRNPFGEVDGERLYKTGDLVRLLANGEVEFLGRIDHQVKVRGFRIELGEIEAALAQHPDVHETVAVVREDTPGAPRVVAYVVRRSGGTTAPDDLKTFVRARLPEFMVPSAVVCLQALPLSPTGKVDRTALPSPADAVPTHGTAVPITAAQEHVMHVWKAVLHVDHVGIDDNFFDIGGSSLLLAQVHARLVADSTPAALSILDMFQLPTIRELAARIAETDSAPQADMRHAETAPAGPSRLKELARRRTADRATS